MLSVTVAFAAAGLGANAATSLTLNDGDTLTGVYEDYEITIAAGATVTFNNATVTRASDNAAVVQTLGDATIILAEGSENSVAHTQTSGYAGAGISSAAGHTLTIDGTGSLVVQGGSGAAGIGANANTGSRCGNIVIADGTIVATGGEGASAIGAGYYESKCGDITIAGGNVTAKALANTASYCPPAIGAGFVRSSCGNILICGGTVTADASDPNCDYSYDVGPAIGASASNCGSITIVDGVERIVATKGANALEIIGMGRNDYTSVGKISRLLRFDAEYSNDGNTVTLTPKASFESYTVTWKNDDGTTADTTSVEYGLLPSHAGLTKAGDGYFEYLFAGWTPEFAEVESNVAYTAVFIAVPAVRSTGGDAEWFVDADEGALRSGVIGNSQNTWLRTSLPRPCVFSFKWKTSSETGCDQLHFMVNGAYVLDTEGRQVATISGVGNDWTTVSVVISNSLDVLEWKYGKDGSAVSGQDCGWVKDFEMATFDGEIRSLSVVPNYDGLATVTAYAAKDVVMDVFPPLARHGYALLGYFTAAEGGELVEPPYALSADTTLYAHWAKTTDFDTSDPTAEWTIEDDGITWRTGAIGHSTNTWATYTVKRPCTVTYKWKTSTEANNDPLVFYVDDVEQSRISGESADWVDVSLSFEDSKNHVLKWVYSKDWSDTGRYDCGWIRDFVVTPYDSWAVTRELNYEGATELETRYVKKGRQLDVSEFPPLDGLREGYTCYWALAPWSGDALTNAVDISADTTLYAHWIKQHGFDEIDTTCQTPWTWIDDGSIRTGKIGDSGNTWATISVTGPCDISFKWMTSSETGWDKLHFYVDDSHKIEISGVTPEWESYTASVGSGDHVLKWTYTKDGGGAFGEDCGWVKDIVITAPDSAPYTVTWKNADGTTLETDADLEAGAVPVYNSALPTQAATAQYYFDFAGWEPDFELVSSNTTYTAKYTATLRSYDVTWQDENGTALDAQTLYYGTTPEYAGETPTKAATPKYTYTFAGWMPEVATVTGEATYTAKYDATVNKYTITWQNEDGSVLGSDEVEYDDTPAYTGETPTKAADAQYTYTFAGWSPAVSTVAGEATYTATFNSILRSYTITWKDDTGAVIDTTTVNYGDTPTHAAPTKASTAQYDYTFAGWGDVVAVTGEATYQATFTPVLRSYTITWVVEGATVASGLVAYGTVPAYGGDTPTKESTAEYDYTFAGWGNVVAVTGAATYTAQFNATKRSYTITWANIDGAGAIATSTAEYGTTPSYSGATPTKASTAEYSYAFTGWSPTVAAVTGDATYTAQFSQTKRSYTVSWVVEGETVASGAVEYGQTPAYDGDTPTKESTAEYSYEFTGWSPTVAAVTGAATYTAQFNATKRSYMVSWVVDGMTVASGAVEYGQTPEFVGETPTKESTAEYSYEFTGWMPVVAAVTGDATYTAQFNATKRSYTITWVVEGETVASGAVEYGQTPAYSGATPTKAETAEYTYTFAGWSPAVAAVTGDTVYTATFNAIPKGESGTIDISTLAKGDVVQNGSVLTGTAPNLYLKIADGATITLDGASITNSGHGVGTIHCLGDATIILAPGSTNTVVGTVGRYCTGNAIYVPTNSTLTIRGSGALYADSSSSEFRSAAIGAFADPYNSDYVFPCGDIVIEGGTIVANGGVGIGASGNGGYCGNITITGDANVTATATVNGSAGIGAAGSDGNCGNITISGNASVTATGQYYGPGIGAADHSTCGDIVISTTGMVTATGNFFAPGIGAPGAFETCKCGDITITGGTVIAAGSYHSPGIGTDYYFKRNGTCGSITIADTITMVTAQGMDDSPGIYRPEDSDPYFASGSNLDLVKSDENRLYTLTPVVAPDTYTVTWKNDDGNTLETDVGVAYGATPVYDGETPAKAADAQYTYTFAGWTPAVAAVTGDTVYTATFTPVTRSYTVTWVVEGETVASGAVEYGTTPTYSGDTPTKESTAEYSYAFTGWNPTVVSMTGDATYTAQFSQTKRSYTITWIVEGATVASGAVEYGQTPTYSGDTSTKAETAEYTYTFTGWSPTVATVTGAATYTAQFSQTKRSYTVSWVVEGATVASGSVEYGQTPAYGGDTPTKESTAEYSYAFTGWNPTVVSVTGDVIYIAQFSQTKRSYTVSWVVEGETVASGAVEYGTTPSYTGETPAKASTAEYSYSFTGWSPAVAAVTGEATYTAQFEATKRSYTVAWVVEGATVASGSVEYGQTPEYGGDTPTKPETAEYTYTFNGWTPAIAAVTDDAIYTATFTATPKETEDPDVPQGLPDYVTTGGSAEWFVDTDGSWRSGVIGHDQNTWIETTVTGPCLVSFQWRVSSEEGYDQLHLTVDGEERDPISGSADWDNVSLTFRDAGSHTIRWKYSKDGSASDGDDCGWVRNFATTPKEFDTYTVTWKNWDGTVLGTNSVLEDDMPEYTAATPIRPKDDEYTYVFNGWSPDIVAATGNVEYTATYTALPNLPASVTTGGNAEWFVDTDGSWRSGAIMNSQETWIETTVTGPCLVTFSWKASSEGGGYDMLALAVDGEEKDSIGGVMSDWVAYSLPMPEAGSHTVRWTYYKDSSAWEGEDCGWVKDFTATPKEFATYTVTWKNWDGTVLAEDSVVEGYMPVYRGETPARATDEEYYYTFSGWTPVVASVTGDAIYTATFDAYQARFEMVMDGTTVTGYIGLVPKHITLADWPEGVTAIADDVFSGYSHVGTYTLESVEIPATVQTIGQRAFYSSYGLTNLVFEAGGTQPLEIGFAAFSFAYALESVTLPERLASIADSGFYQCDKLAEVTFLGGRENVTIGRSAFKGTPYYSMLPFKMILMEIDGQQKVVSYQGTLPEVISLADWPAEATAIAGGSLGWNSIVKDITIPSTITSVDAQAFYSSYELTNVVFAVAAPGVDPAPLAIEESAFGECGKLRSVTLRDGLARIAGYAFSGCPLLAEVNFPPSGTDGAYIADSAFAGTEYESHLPFKFYVDESNIVTGFRGECPANIGGEGGVPWPDNISGIGSDAFSGCTTLVHVTFPAGIEAVALGAFRGCGNLASVNFANCFATLTAIGGESFSGCTSLETVELDGDGLYIDSSAFESCTSLTTLTLGSGVSKVDEFAFAYSTSLAAFVNNSSAVIDETAFLGTAYNKNQPFSFITKRQWGELVLAGYRGECPAQITADMWPAGVTYVNRKSFPFCDTLRAVEFPANIGYIDESAFACCTNLASITFPEEGSLHVGHNAFALCTKLQNVTLKSGMEVENDAFGGCASLETVIVEEGVRTIGPGAFARTLVRSIVLPEGIHWVDNMSFAGNDGDFTLYIPRNADDGNYGVSDGTVEYEYYPLRQLQNLAGARFCD